MYSIFGMSYHQYVLFSVALNFTFHQTKISNVPISVIQKSPQNASAAGPEVYVKCGGPNFSRSVPPLAPIIDFLHYLRTVLSHSIGPPYYRSVRSVGTELLGITAIFNVDAGDLEQTL